MSAPSNPFPIIGKNVDLVKHREVINKNIEKITQDYNKLFKGIDEKYAKNNFWRLAKGEKDYNPYNWYDVYAVFLGRFAGFQALLEEDKRSKQIYTLHIQWFDYLSSRIKPHQLKIPNSFLINLFRNLPVVDYETTLHILKESASIMKEYNLREVLSDPKEDPISKIRRFKETYLNCYSFFLKRCEFFGNELSKNEDKKKFGNYGHKLHRIFQLYKDNELTPPPLVKEVLILLKHIRNSLAHSEYKLLENDQINLRDLDWNLTIPLYDLWNYFQLLLIMDREFNNLALFLFINNWIRELTRRYNRYFQCRDCGAIEIYLMPPETQFIICRKCQMLNLL